MRIGEAEEEAHFFVGMSAGGGGSFLLAVNSLLAVPSARPDCRWFSGCL